MTIEELEKVPFHFVAHMSMEDMHTTTYESDDGRFGFCDHVPFKDGEPHGRAFRHYRMPFVAYFNEHGMSFSISDNDMRWLGNNVCCCGDKLAKHATGFDVTAMIMKRNNRPWSLDNVLKEVGCYRQCKAYDLFTSNRTEGCKTVEDFYRMRFGRSSSPFSPKFQYYHAPTLF